jgi:hypothetical protein
MTHQSAGVNINNIEKALLKGDVAGDTHWDRYLKQEASSDDMGRVRSAFGGDVEMLPTLLTDPDLGEYASDALRGAPVKGIKAATKGPTTGAVKATAATGTLQEAPVKGIKASVAKGAASVPTMKDEIFEDLIDADLKKGNLGYPLSPKYVWLEENVDEFIKGLSNEQKIEVASNMWHAPDFFRDKLFKSMSASDLAIAAHPGHRPFRHEATFIQALVALSKRLDDGEVPYEELPMLLGLGDDHIRNLASKALRTAKKVK